MGHCSMTCLTVAGSLAVGTSAMADIPADLGVNGGSIATIRLSITVTGELGSETQSDEV